MQSEITEEIIKDPEIMDEVVKVAIQAQEIRVTRIIQVIMNQVTRGQTRKDHIRAEHQDFRTIRNNLAKGNIMCSLPVHVGGIESYKNEQSMPLPLLYHDG